MPQFTGGRAKLLMFSVSECTRRRILNCFLKFRLRNILAKFVLRRIYDDNKWCILAENLQIARLKLPYIHVACDFT